METMTESPRPEIATTTTCTESNTMECYVPVETRAERLLRMSNEIIDASVAAIDQDHLTDANFHQWQLHLEIADELYHLSNTMHYLNGLSR